ncbi:MAG: adenylosuccinate lyase [Anaerolinea sp.]|nr:adenylosuccinate lyase [Anaerolinea sp.]
MVDHFRSYQSPFSWRYGSPEMRRVWSEEYKRLLWRQLWVTLAETQVEWGLVTLDQAADLREHAGDIDIPRALELEEKLHHDLMAEIKVFAAQCKTGGGIIHLGATSMDIKDNAEAMQVKEGLAILSQRLSALLEPLAGLIEEYAALPVMGFTHLQPAEPTTLGYRLANIGQDLLVDWHNLGQLYLQMKGKGFKGAVGNAASYVMLLGEAEYELFEKLMSDKMGLPFFRAATQTYTRKQDLEVLNTLSSLGATLYKFALDLRLLQSEVIGEVAEPFGGEQVGSSAMPFKRNPIQLEKITSLARELSALPAVAWNNYAHSMLERTLDDSANRRTILPEAFLIVDEILGAFTKIICGLQVRKEAVERTLAKFAPFAAVEPVLMALVKHGADRQEMHELLRGLSIRAWEAVQHREVNPLQELVLGDKHISSMLSKDQLDKLFDVSSYTGIAEKRALEMARKIRSFTQG